MTDEIDNVQKMYKKLAVSAVLKHFRTMQVPVIVYDTIDSTNTRARALLEEGKKPPFVLAANEQTAGRGRHGNSFFSPESGLYYTLVIHPRDMQAAIEKTTIAAAVSLRAAIAELSGISCGIKWVNDLYLDHRKVAGILCEAPCGRDGVPSGIIIGIGVNVSQKEFPAELRDKAGSLNCPDLDRNALTARLTEHLLSWCEHLNDPELIDEYRRYSIVLGHEVEFMRDGKRICGRAVDIREDGSLVVEAEQPHILNSGEISLLSF